MPFKGRLVRKWMPKEDAVKAALQLLLAAAEWRLLVSAHPVYESARQSLPDPLWAAQPPPEGPSAQEHAAGSSFSSNPPEYCFLGGHGNSRCGVW